MSARRVLSVVAAEHGQFAAEHAAARASDPTDLAEVKAIVATLPPENYSDAAFEVTPLRAARHEAGHVVAALILGGAVGEVNIEPVGRRGGRTVWIHPPGSVADRLWAAMVVGMAGRAVDQLAGHHDLGCEYDVRMVFDEASRIVAGGERPSRYAEPLTSTDLFAAACANARRLIVEHRCAVDAVAEAIVAAAGPDRRGSLRDPDLRPLLASTADRRVRDGSPDLAC